MNSLFCLWDSGQGMYTCIHARNSMFCFPPPSPFQRSCPPPHSGGGGWQCNLAKNLKIQNSTSVGHQKSFEKTSTTVVRQSPTTIRAGWGPSPLFQHVGQRLVPPMAGSYSHVGKLLRPFKKLAAVCIASLYYKIFQCIHWKYWSSIINHQYHHFLAWQWHWWQCWCAQALWDGRSSPTFSWCHFQLERPREAHGMPFTSAVIHLLFAVYLPGPRRCQQRLGQTTRKRARPPCQARPAIRFGDSLPTAAEVACHILPYSTGSGGQNAILKESPAGCSTTGCWSNVGAFSNTKWGSTNRGLF